MFYFLLSQVKNGAAAMRVSSKGQVTIPKKLRDQIGIRTGSEVEFGISSGEITIRRKKSGGRPGPTRGEKIVAEIRKTATARRGLSTDEIMRLLRGDD
jgi:AbrB family looped-hinge helix DNA binding protein